MVEVHAVFQAENINASWYGLKRLTRLVGPQRGPHGATEESATIVTRFCANFAFLISSDSFMYGVDMNHIMIRKVIYAVHERC